MDDESFKKALRAAVLIGGCVMGAIIGIYLLVVAGYAAHAYINQIDPDPPYLGLCSDQCKDNYGNLINCTHKVYAAPASADQAKDAGIQSDSGK